MKIYVAGPLSAETEEAKMKNVEAAMSVAVELLHKGHIAVIPHLTHHVANHARKIGREIGYGDYDFWLGYDHAFYVPCHALFYMAPSHGADIELEWAKYDGKQVFYSLDEVPTEPRISLMRERSVFLAERRGTIGVWRGSDWNSA